MLDRESRSVGVDAAVAVAVGKRGVTLRCEVT